MSSAKLLLTWLGLPIYIWQGIGVRMRTDRLLPPTGPNSGEIAGKGDVIRLLVLGDSSAVGIGVEDTRDNLAGHLTHILKERSGRPIEWRTAGFNSATSGQLRDFAVPNLERREYTDIVLSIGTNDVKNLHTLSRFKREFGGLIYALKARFPGARIFWSPALDMRMVPALPSPMNGLMEIRAQAINHLGARLCAERGAIAVERLPEVTPDGFSRDGFHAGAAGYEYWAGHLADHMLARQD